MRFALFKLIIELTYVMTNSSTPFYVPIPAVMQQVVQIRGALKTGSLIQLLTHSPSYSHNQLLFRLLAALNSYVKCT